MAGIDPQIGYQLTPVRSPTKIDAIDRIVTVLEKMVALMEEQQAANMRLVENLLKEAHDND